VEESNECGVIYVPIICIQVYKESTECDAIYIPIMSIKVYKQENKFYIYCFYKKVTFKKVKNYF